MKGSAINGKINITQFYFITGTKRDTIALSIVSDKLRIYRVMYNTILGKHLKLVEICEQTFNFCVIYAKNEKVHFGNCNSGNLHSNPLL